MSDDFRWEIEQEEEAWGQTGADDDTVKRSLRLPRWALIGLGLVGLTAVSLVAIFYWRLWTATNAAKAELFATHSLFQETLLTRDKELLGSLVQADDEDWFDLQQRFLAVGLYQQQPSLGLWGATAGDETAVSPPTITLSDDLTLAEVVAERPFATLAEDNQAATVILQQTSLYQQSDNGWQLAPIAADPDFWGEWAELERPLLTLGYPDRDGEISQRLADDLSQLLVDVCAIDTVNCPATFYFDIRFDTDPATNLDFSFQQQNLSINRNRERLTSFRLPLPTPTLVGLPQDEAGYQALQRGYGAWLAAILVVNFAGDEATITADSVADYLAPLGLSVPPSHQSHLPGGGSALPDQDVLLLCADPQLTLHRYNPATGKLTETTNPIAAEEIMPYQMWPLPDDSGLGLGLGDGSLTQPAKSWQFWLLLAEEARLAATKGISANQEMTVGSTGNRLHSPERIFWQAYTIRGTPGSMTYDSLAIDLRGCTVDSCFDEPEAEIVWPENGRFGLQQTATGELSLVDSITNETSPVVQGVAPQWLDAETFVFLGNQGESGTPTTVHQAQLTATNEVRSEPLIALAELQAMAPSGTQLFLRSLAGSPDETDTFYISTGIYESASQTYAALFFGYDRAEKQLQLLADARPESRVFFESELINGRYFVSLVFPDHVNSELYNSQTTVTIDDLVTKTKQAHTITASLNSYRYDWSQDGNWFLLLEDGLLRLISPATNSQQTIFHRFEGCDNAAWTTRSGS
ncbi:MAG: hypothetical protein AAF614_21220 [Chloroflexota bacterium]